MFTPTTGMSHLKVRGFRIVFNLFSYFLIVTGLTVYKRLALNGVCSPSIIATELQCSIVITPRLIGLSCQ